MNVWQQSANALTNGINGTQAVMNGGNFGFGAAQAGPVGQINGMNMSGYMNPYTQNVIDTTMGTLDRQRQQMLGQVGAQATAAGAFGGSRHGLVEAETNRGFADTMASTAAGLNQSNFQNAQQMGQFDINNQMSNGQFNAGLQQQASQANQSAALQQQGLKLNAAGQMGNLANMGFGMGQQASQMQNAAGQQQQAIQQQIINGIMGQFAGYQNAPQQGLQGMVGAVGGAPYSQSQTQTSNPGLLGLLSGGASILGGLGLCWVARASFGEDNPEWVKVRLWMQSRAPKWLHDAYVKYGPALGDWIERNPIVKPAFRTVLRGLVRL